MALAVSFLSLCLLLLPPAAPRSPWAGFKPGSYVKTRSVTLVTVGSHKLETVTEITQTLVEVKADRAVIETVATMQGVPRPTRTRAEVSLSEAPAPVPGTRGKSGSQALTVAGRSLTCAWTESQTDMAGTPTRVTTWTSAKVPGGLVKSLSQSPLAETTLEVLAFEAR
jgi:hypothetical protein